MSGDGASRSGLVKANCRPNGSECLSEAVAYGDLEMDVLAERREAQRERERDADERLTGCLGSLGSEFI